MENLAAPREPGTLNTEVTLLDLTRQAATRVEHVAERATMRVERLVGPMEEANGPNTVRPATMHGGVVGEIESLLRDVLRNIDGIEGQLDRI